MGATYLWWSIDISRRRAWKCTGTLLVAATLVMSSHAWSLSLPDAIDLAIEHNPAVLAALHDRDSARYSLQAARGGYLPRLDLEYGYSRAELDDRITRLSGTQSDSFERRDASVQLTQTLFDGLEVYHRVGRASARLDVARFTVNSTADQLALETAGTYLEVLRREKNLALADDNLQAHRRIRTLIGRRSAGGVSRGSDSSQAESRLALAVATVRQEQAALDDARAAFLRLTGRSAEDLFVPISPASYLPVAWQAAHSTKSVEVLPDPSAPQTLLLTGSTCDPVQEEIATSHSILESNALAAAEEPVATESATAAAPLGCAPDQGRDEATLQAERAALQEVLSATRARHPRILAARASVVAARSAVGQALSAYSPKISLEVVGSRSEDRIDDEITDVEAGFRARWNLFHGTSDWANARAASADLDRALEDERQTELEVTEVLSQSVSALTSARDRAEQFRRYAHAISSAQTAYMRQYSIGQRSLLDLVNAQDEVFSARTQLVSAELAEIYSAYRVLAAMGVLLPTMGIKLPSAGGYEFRQRMR